MFHKINFLAKIFIRKYNVFYTFYKCILDKKCAVWFYF